MAKQFAYVLAAVLSAMFLSACNNDGYDSPMPDLAEEANAYVDLCISVVANNSVTPGSSGTRTANDTTFFQEGVKPYEEINSLRVIMVNGNKVEYNEFIKGPEGSSTQEVKNITLRTSPGGTRKIYLIANEAVLPKLMPKDLSVDLESIKKGDNLFPTTLTGIILTTQSAGMPLFDDGKTYVPMTEAFDVSIELPETWEPEQGPYTQRMTMFVTRAAVKFSFIIQKSLMTKDGETSPFVLGKDYRISNITIKSTALREFLFPNNTTYFPSKACDFKEREIISYDTPSSTYGEVNIPISAEAYAEPSNFSIVKEDKYGILKKDEEIFTYEPPAYFPETKLSDGYTMDVTIDWVNNIDGQEVIEQEIIESIPLTNMDYGLPRNTHVLVIITPGNHDLKAEAVLVPYIGVELDPEFGFENLRPAKDPDQPDPEQPEQGEETNQP